MAPTGSWIPIPTPGDVRVTAVRVAGADVFALGSRPGGGSAILKRQGLRFVIVSEHPATFVDLCSVPSRCLFAIGPDRSACFDGVRWTEHALPAPVDGLRRIWECSTSELYAVAASQLLYFDGATWQRVPFHGTSTESVAWSDGDGCSGSGAWLVGRKGAASTFATGSKMNWTLAGDCSDPSLGLVRVFGRDDAVAVGQRLWQLEKGKWREGQPAPSSQSRALFVERVRGDLVVGVLRPTEQEVDILCCCRKTTLALDGTAGDAAEISLSPLPTGHLVLRNANGQIFQSRIPILCPPG